MHEQMRKDLLSRLLHGDESRNASLESIIDSASDSTIQIAHKAAFELAASDGIILSILTSHV